jgi:hypothetical protein
VIHANVTLPVGGVARGTGVGCVLTVTDDGSDKNQTSLQLVTQATATCSGTAVQRNRRTGELVQRPFDCSAEGRGIVCGSLVFLEWDDLIPASAEMLAPGTNLTIEIVLGPGLSNRAAAPQLVNAIVADCVIGAPGPAAVEYLDYNSADSLEDYAGTSLRISIEELTSGCRGVAFMQFANLFIRGATDGSRIQVDPSVYVAGRLTIDGPPGTYDLEIRGKILGDILLPQGSVLGAVEVVGGVHTGAIVGGSGCTILKTDGAHLPRWELAVSSRPAADIVPAALWRLDAMDDGYYAIINTVSGKALDIRGAGGEGADLIHWQTHLGNNQQFRLMRPNGGGQAVPANGGVYGLAPRHAPTMRVGHRIGANPVLQAASGGALQLFQLVKKGAAYSIRPALDLDLAVIPSVTELIGFAAVSPGTLGAMSIIRTTIGAVTASQIGSFAFEGSRVLGAATVVGSGTVRGSDMQRLTITVPAGGEVEISDSRLADLRGNTSGRGTLTCSGVAVSQAMRILPANAADRALVMLAGESRVGDLTAGHPGLGVTGITHAQKLTPNAFPVTVAATGRLQVGTCLEEPQLVIKQGGLVEFSRLAVGGPAAGAVALAGIRRIGVLAADCESLRLTGCEVTSFESKRAFLLEVAGASTVYGKGLLPATGIFVGGASRADLSGPGHHVVISDTASMVRVNSDASIWMFASGKHAPIDVKYATGAAATFYVTHGYGSSGSLRNMTGSPVQLCTEVTDTPGSPPTLTWTMVATNLTVAL